MYLDNVQFINDDYDFNAVYVLDEYPHIDDVFKSIPNYQQICPNRRSSAKITEIFFNSLFRQNWIMRTSLKN